MITEIPSNLKLPPRLKYVKGRAGTYTVEFQSDFDAAVYFIGKKITSRGEYQQQVINWLLSLGIDFEDIQSHRKEILEVVRKASVEYVEREYDQENWTYEPSDHLEYDFRIPALSNNFSLPSDDEEDDETIEGLDSLLEDIKEEKEDEVPEGLDSLLAEIVEKKSKTVKINPSKLISNINLTPVDNNKNVNGSFDKIITSLDTIINILKGDINLQQKVEKTKKREEEKKKRGSRENKLESSKLKLSDDKKVENEVKEFANPIKDIIDKISGFFLKIFLGAAIVKLVKWFSDPENESKVKSITRFIKDWWPALLGGYVLFGTALGKLIRSVVGIVGSAIPKLVGLLGKLGKFAIKNPAVAAVAGVATLAGMAIAKNMDGTMDDVREFGGMTGDPMSALMFNQGGGLIPGRGPNKDTVPAMLTKGEYVMSRPAVDKYGVDTLAMMNASAGSTNRPKIVSGMTYANQGGFMGDYDPSQYRKGLISSKHIENPGNTGETYVLGYTKTPEGSVIVKQINQVVEKAGPLGTLFGQSDKLTGVSPESNTWNVVLNSENTKKELSTTVGTGRSKKTKIPDIKTDPQALIAYKHNLQYQQTKNELISKGVDKREAEINAAKISATKLMEGGVNVKRNDLQMKSDEKKDDTDPITRMLMNSILGAAGIFSQTKSDANIESTSTGNKPPTKEGSGVGGGLASNPAAYPKQRKQIILHWTAGGYNNVTGPYHTVFTGDGKKHRLVDYDKTTNHAYRRNTNTIGLALASMGGGSNESNMTQAPTEAQLDSMSTEAATLAKGMGWTTNNIDIRNIMTHGEAGSNKDGRYMHDNYGPKVWGGTGERWDLDKLRKGQQIGQGGNEMRQRISQKMLNINDPIKAQTGGKITNTTQPKIERSQNKDIPKITPLPRSQSPKITHINGGVDSSGVGAQREVAGTEVPEINASTASGTKLQVLGIVGI